MRIAFSAAVLAMTFALSAQAQDLLAPRRDVVITVTLDAHCHVIKSTYNAKSEIYGALHSQAGGPRSNPIPGIGVVVKRNKPPSASRSTIIGETVTGDDGSQNGYHYLFDYSLVTGGAWTAYATKDGATVAIAGTGTYTVSK